MGDSADLFALGIFLVMVVMALGVIIIVFPLWFILHRVLSPFDDLLLREPFFQKSEQLYCMAWPFSYWKTLIYICLIVMPNFSKRTRFKGLIETPSVGKLTTIACRIQFWLMGFSGGLLIALFGYGGFIIYVFPRLQ